MRIVVTCVLLLTVACSSGSDEPSNPITRIDGPAVVDQDDGEGNNGATNDRSDG